MNRHQYDPKHPVDHIEHDQDKRTSIPTTERQGEESVMIEGQPQESLYDMFHHKFRRGDDPELFWLDKYKNDNEETQESWLRTDIRSLYVHEEIDPEQLINRLYKIRGEKKAGVEQQPEMFEEFFREQEEMDELEKIAGYYRHSENWRNRLILGDSLLVMNSLLNREGMKGQVQCIYFDPPYGIKYKGNWQMSINSTNVKDNDDGLSGEPETIKAYRDTWELGINSYLSYLRDRLVLARELLTESGSCFVQISDDNVHLVRTIMDEVFGSENFVSQIIYQKTTGAGSPGELTAPASVADYIIWYAKDRSVYKYRKLFTPKVYGGAGGEAYKYIELEDGRRMSIKEWEKENSTSFEYSKRPKNSKVFRIGDLTSQTGGEGTRFPIEYKGKTYRVTGVNRGWRTNEDGMKRIIDLNRLEPLENTIGYVLYLDDFPVQNLPNLWTDTSSSLGGKKVYVVQSGLKPIQRCILMTTDPGDLVLDPTCGSGTTAYQAEQWGRRWITIDTSRIALNIAKRRLTTALYPYYETHDEYIRHGFIYETVPHITLKSLANALPDPKEYLYDKPIIDRKRIRVSGPLTVETLQNYNVQSPESLTQRKDETEENLQFVERIFNHLKSSGIRNGQKGHAAVFYDIHPVANPYLNARGLYNDEQGQERLAYLMIGPKFGTVSKQAVTCAIQEFRPKVKEEAASTLYVLGFSFEDDITNQDVQVYNVGTFHVVKVRMNDDLLQEGLTNKDKAAGSFIIIGEPDIQLVKDNEKSCHIEIRGMDMYDPIQDRVTERNVADIAYWEMDDKYNGREFNVRSIHFCGGDKKEFNEWKKGLLKVAPKCPKGGKTVREAISHQLRMTFPDEVWEALYGHCSAPIKYEKGKKIAVRVVSQFGEECTEVLIME